MTGTKPSDNGAFQLNSPDESTLIFQPGEAAVQYTGAVAEMYVDRSMLKTLPVLISGAVHDRTDETEDAFTSSLKTPFASDKLSSSEPMAIDLIIAGE
ncbi:MAG: hypothetical protein EBU88_19900 [Acidobacteria bacterium]|nr:hypothetical protein [Acidobacteriota bacterium]